jgi:DNA invertase Pin-like site-specific DNA recombinase
MVELRQTGSPARAKVHCAVYTRKSSEEGLEQVFNSLDAQREACEAYITSQKHEGWAVLATLYDDGAYSGGTMDRPALQRLLEDVRTGKIDVVVVYKVDRLTRSLADFAKIVEVFDAQGVSFVSVTQAFNTTTSMGRLTLNVLLSFAQFEREVTGERIRDKIAASKKKGMWMGVNPRSATTSRNGNSLSMKRKRRPCEASFDAILNSGPCAPCGMISPPQAWSANAAWRRMGAPMAASGFRAARSI